MNGTHPCENEATLATMCEQLKNIEGHINEIKTFQTLFMNRLEASSINSAKYPSPEVVNRTMAKVDRHETYFKISFGILIFLVPVVVLIADKVWA